MRGKGFLDSEADETNRWAVFEIKNVEIAGPLEPGKAMPAKIRGTLTIRGKPVETVAESTIYYLRLTPEQVESQKRFGLTAETLRITSKFPTTFTSHGLQVPQGVNNTEYRPGAVPPEMPTLLAGTRAERMRRAQSFHARARSVERYDGR